MVISMAAATLGAAAIGALGGAGNSAGSALMAYNLQKKLKQYDYELNQRGLRENPLASREGYVRAGYNPLLALGSSGTGFSSASSAPSVDSSGLSSGINSALQAVQAQSQIENVQADTQLKTNQGETERARQIQMDFQNAMYDVEAHLKQKDLSTYDRRFYANLYEQMQRAENYRAQSAVSQMNAETNRMNAITSKQSAKANYEIDQYNARTNRYRNSQSGFGFSRTGYDPSNLFSNPYYNGNNESFHNYFDNVYYR